MAKNRLNLDFSLPTNIERIEFIEKYLALPQWKINPLTPDELETIGNYLLYGKDENGKNAVQHKDVQIATRYGTWDRKEEESYESLLENPSFNENSIHPINDPAITKIKRENFSREEAAKNPEMLALLKPLWKKIDNLDLVLNFYDLRHGKRKKPIRPELLEKFTQQEILDAESQAAHLNQYQYLKRRHLLVEYRSEQFSIRDNFIDPIINLQSVMRPPVEYKVIELNGDIPVYPLGFFDESEAAPLIFKPFKEMRTEIFNEEQLSIISRYLWNFAPEEKDLKNNHLYFDFTNPEHVINLYLNYFDMVWDKTEKNLKPFILKTLDFYEENTHLEDYQREILYLKVKKIKNEDVAALINSKYNKTYTANYISTIFRQKLIPKICATAAYHKKLIENIFYEENFKKCNTCGRWHLIDTDNFVRKAKSPDGFSSKCKICDKADRKRRAAKKKE